MKYEKKLLIIPDIHTHYAKAERIISKYKKTHKFIFTGDYFDNFGDTPELNASTAKFLKDVMQEHPEWVYIFGNHDVIYHPQFSCMCSGFSTNKKTAINEVLEIEDWNKLKFFHVENGHWFSHAGITKYWFQHPVKEEINIETVQAIIDESITKLTLGNYDNAIWASSYARGGIHTVGGIVWQDDSDMELIYNMHQVYGHTPIKKIRIISDNMLNASITNVDSSGSGVFLSELLEIDENGNKSKLDTAWI